MKAVLVIGCSSGIGQATALHLADFGYRVFAGLRHRNDVHSYKVLELGDP
jgi:NAD(P)-dependent dehydrogenase (short-subunit alcohol dehydrogenase family)